MTELETPTDLMHNRGLYLYAGLQAGASADDVLARAEADDAPWAHSEELRAWVADGLEQLS